MPRGGVPLGFELTVAQSDLQPAIGKDAIRIKVEVRSPSDIPMESQRGGGGTSPTHSGVKRPVCGH